MEIKYYTREIYGNIHKYPLDFVREIRQLTGRKTLTGADCLSLRALGFTLVQVLPQQTEKQIVIEQGRF